MSSSRLQDPFLDEVVDTIRAAKTRIAAGLDGRSTDRDEQIRRSFEHLSAKLSPEEKKMIERIVWDELRGALHGILVTFDGGTALADRGLISIQDEDGREFDRHLHELAIQRLTPEELE